MSTDLSTYFDAKKTTKKKHLGRYHMSINDKLSSTAEKNKLKTDTYTVELLSELLRDSQ